MLAAFSRFVCAKSLKGFWVVVRLQTKIFIALITVSFSLSIFTVLIKHVHSREFNQWKMGYIPDNTFSQHMTLEYSVNDTFNSYDMSGQSIHELLKV